MAGVVEVVVLGVNGGKLRIYFGIVWRWGTFAVVYGLFA